MWSYPRKQQTLHHRWVEHKDSEDPCDLAAAAEADQSELTTA